LASDWWWGNIWCWRKCDSSWYGTLPGHLETWKEYSYSHCLVLCTSLQTMVSSFWDSAFRIIPCDMWTVSHASSTTEKHQPLFSSKMEWRQTGC
jgi:hypothetical protein